MKNTTGAQSVVFFLYKVFIIKVMKKIILLVFSLLFVCLGYSQKKPIEKTSTAGIHILVPIGNLAKTNKPGLGMSVETEFSGKNNAGFTLNTGYNYYRSNGESKPLIQFPALAGLKYHFGDMVAIGQQFGVSYITQGYGLQYTYSTYFSFGWDKLYSDLRYVGTTNADREKSLSSLYLRVSYKL